MSTQKIAERLVELSRKGDFRTAQDELFSSDAASVEPEGSMWETVKGIEKLNEKVTKWEGMVEEIHGIEVSDPLVSGDFFTCTMAFDLTVAGAGRTSASEIAVYEVRDGKIVLEHFFYKP